MQFIFLALKKNITLIFFFTQVLCHADVAWENCDFNNIPSNAVLIGSSKRGQKLYVGRAHYKNTITPGKVIIILFIIYSELTGWVKNWFEF